LRLDGQAAAKECSKYRTGAAVNSSYSCTGKRRGQDARRERDDRRWEFVGLCRMKRLAEREELVASSSK
jgi:hypothetical protein